VADYHDGFHFGILVQQLAELRETRLWPQGEVNLKLSFITHLVAHE